MNTLKTRQGIEVTSGFISCKVRRDFTEGVMDLTEWGL